jgi:hypothetical protein
MHLFAFAMHVDVRLAQQEVGVAGESGERGTRPGVPRVGEDPAGALGPQSVRLDVVPDGAGGEAQAAVAGGVAVVQRPEVEERVEERGVRAPCGAYTGTGAGGVIPP